MQLQEDVIYIYQKSMNINGKTIVYTLFVYRYAASYIRCFLHTPFVKKKEGKK